LFLLFSISLLSSCATRYKDALFQSKTDFVTDTLKTIYVVNDHGPEDVYYRIKPTDILAIRNLQNNEFGAQGTGGQAAAASFSVEPDGTVMLPVIGKVEIAGLTRRGARQKIQDLYSKTLLKDPIIELMIINLKVTLLGEFAGKGNILLEKDNTTLVDILGQTGGLNAGANPENIKIIRGDRKNPEIIYVNLKNINTLGNPKLVLQNNDIIYAEPKSTGFNQQIQTVMTYAQPILIFLNMFIVINSLTR